jgi:cytochrome oxidase assembly protein ShyY1
LFFTPRWLGYLTLTVVFGLIASMLGLWQWDRRDQALAAIDLVENNYDTSATDLSPYLGDNPFTSADEWTSVVARGEYVASEQVLVRTRPRSGNVGFAVLVPFRTSAGTVMVNRGWIPTGASNDYPDLLPEAPKGTVSIMGRLKPGEPVIPGRGAPQGQLPSIDLVALQALTSEVIDESFYVSLESEVPSVSPTPLPLERPALDEGPHLSYAFQWFVFAIMGFFGYFWLLRDQDRADKGIPKDLPTRPSDAEEEDALLEAHRG